MSKLLAVLTICVLLSGDFNVKHWSVHAGSHVEEEDHHSHDEHEEHADPCGLPDAYTEVRTQLNVTKDNDLELEDVDELVHHIREEFHCENATCKPVRTTFRDGPLRGYYGPLKTLEATSAYIF